MWSVGCIYFFTCVGGVHLGGLVLVAVNNELELHVRIPHVRRFLRARCRKREHCIEQANAYLRSGCVYDHAPCHRV